ncbi:MAG: molybdopterin-dependent oxidoreductase [Deltaproteobacteria bacterium]|nr:molybdopterin-dependent oxidoreductase [Deltaproteobacteria bacterium]
MKKNSPGISRRKILLGALNGTGLLLLSGCENIFNRLHQNQSMLTVLESVEGLNRRFLRLLTGRNKLAQEFSEKDISRYFKPNGNPPPFTMEYVLDATNGWPFWRLQVAGMVKQPVDLSLQDLRAMPARTQITRHDCVEGWSAIAKWKGVPLTEISRRVEPEASARYVVFYCMDTDARGSHYYESVDLHDANHPQTILAYEMNDQPLPIEHGAPLRLRVETQLGYKMAKYIHRIEYVASVKEIGSGRGGYWEDQGYEWYAGI